MRKLPIIGLLLVLGMLMAACQAPTAQVDSQLSNVQATIEQPPTEAPTATAAPAPTDDSSQADTPAPSDSASSDPATDEPDPLSVDPARPGFTLDGSPTLGAADAPVVIIDFSDFQ